MSKSKKRKQSATPRFEMQVETREEAREAILSITIDETSVEEAMRRAARKLSRQMNIPGFRKGHAPYNIILRQVGEAALREEAADLLLEEVFPLALEQAGIEPYRQAKLLSMELSPLQVRIAVPLEPTVEVGDFRALRVPYEPPTVDEEEVDAEVEKLRDEMLTYVPVERPAQEGDRLLASRFVLRGAETFEAGEEEPFPILLDRQLIGDEMTEALIGIEAGESRSFTATLPDREELFGSFAGQQVEVEITVEAVEEGQKPAIDEAFANAAGYETVEQMREAIRERMLAERLKESEEAYARAVEDALLEQAEVRYPAALLDETIDSIIAGVKADVEKSLPWSDFLRLTGKTEESYREELKENTDRLIRRDLVFQAVAEALKLEPDGDELMAYIKEHYPDSLKEGQLVIDEERLGQAMAALLYDKAREAMLAIARGQWQEEPAEGEAGDEAVSTGAEEEETLPEEHSSEEEETA